MMPGLQLPNKYKYQADSPPLQLHPAWLQDILGKPWSGVHWSQPWVWDLMITALSTVQTIWLDYLWWWSTKNWQFAIIWGTLQRGNGIISILIWNKSRWYLGGQQIMFNVFRVHQSIIGYLGYTKLTSYLQVYWQFRPVLCFSVLKLRIKKQFAIVLSVNQTCNP